jgi:hypothetical protein
MRKRTTALPIGAAAAAILLAGCSGQPLSTREKGTLGGAGLGGAAGAIIGAGSVIPRPAPQSARVCGVTGYAVGNSLQNQEAANQQTQLQLTQQQHQIEQQRLEIERLRQQSETE